jgi:hypothetical protein
MKKPKRMWAEFGATFLGFVVALALAAVFIWLYSEIIVPTTQ